MITRINPTPVKAMSFFMGETPIISSLTPTKNNMINAAVRYFRSVARLINTSKLIVLFTGSHRENENKIAAKIIIPPIVGTLRAWSFRSSPGISTSCFSLATLIKDGVVMRTTINEVKNPKIISFTVLGLKIYVFVK
jgi:hypothetical protein